MFAVSPSVCEPLRLMNVNERPLLGDNPSDHDVLIIAVQKMNSYIETTNSTLRRLEDKVDSVLILRSEVERVLRWQDNHDRHHGPDDEAIAKRIGPVLGWRVFAGAVALGAGLASVVGLMIQLS